METITLRVGENHILALPGLGSAGYQWTLQSADSEIVSVEEMLRAGAYYPAGSGSLTQRFELIALTPGKTRILFHQARSFAPNPPHATHEIELTVV